MPMKMIILSHIFVFNPWTMAQVECAKINICILDIGKIETDIMNRDNPQKNRKIKKITLAQRSQLRKWEREKEVKIKMERETKLATKNM